MIPCLMCKANCCKHYDVFIDHTDVINLTKNNDFLPIKKMEYKKSFGYVPKFKLYENGKKRSWVLCLSNPNRICIFLKNDTTCSVYDKRPFICRNYPFTYENGKIKEIKNLCPKKWKLEEEKKIEIENDYKQLLLNFLKFETICSDWNKIVKQSDNLENFLKFIINYKIDDIK